VSLMLCPLFVYAIDATAGTSSEWEASIVQRPWELVVETTGGQDESAAGIPEAFVIRRDQILSVRLRFWESEWLALEEMVAYLQDTASPLRFHARRSMPGDMCYLVSPKVGDRFAPSRGDKPGTHEVTIQLRKVDGSRWNLSYFSPMVVL
jgi:hypothetical protein